MAKIKKAPTLTILPPYVERFIDAAAELGSSFGLNRTVCQIYALLYLSPHAISPAEIGRSLSISRGNVSINLRILEEWNAITKIWKKGAARPRYKANEKIEEVIFAKLQSGLSKRTKALQSAMSDISSKLHCANPEEIAHAQPLLEKVNRLRKTLDFLIENIDSIKSLT